MGAAEHVMWMCSISLLAWIGTCSPGDTELAEYCQWEVFNATCGPGEVILMRHAHYGRMRLGRCLTTEVYIGCTSDILPQMDARCSGRTHCEVHIPDSTLHAQLPCPKDVMFYMEAEYTCLQVTSGGEEDEAAYCSSSTGDSPSPVEVGAAGTNLASSLLVPGGLGSHRCPWTLQVLRGQTIAIFVLDFTMGATAGYARDDDSYWDSYSAEDTNRNCPVTVHIEEPGQNAETVCVGQQREREELVYSSRGHVVQIIISQQASSEEVNFLLKAEVRGCSDPVLPSSGWLTRTPGSASVGCNFTTQRWHLVCKDTHWVGSVGNCTKDSDTHGITAQQHITAPYGLLIAVIIGIIIGVVCGFTMLACVLWCKKRGTRRQPRHPYTTPDAGQYGEVLVPNMDCKVHRLGEYGYTHVWEVQKQQQQQQQQQRHPASIAGTMPRSTRESMEMCQSCTLRHSAGSTPTVIFHKKEHIYESPQFAESVADSGITSEGSSAPFYHEFDMANQQCQQSGAGQVASSVDVKGDVTEGTSDDTDDDLEDKMSVFIKPPGYNLVPKSPEGERHENQYS